METQVIMESFVFKALVDEGMLLIVKSRTRDSKRPELENEEIPQR